MRASQWRDAAPAADADLREARAVLGLRLGVVLGDLHPADGLARGLHRPAAAGLLARRTRPAAEGAAQPRPAARAPRAFETDEAPDGRDSAAAWLTRKRYRVVVAPTGTTIGLAPSAGYLREAGNLLFHLSVLIVLVGFALGGLWGFKGGVIVVTKDGFANTLSQYDDFRAGALFDPADARRPSTSPSTTSTSPSSARAARPGWRTSSPPTSPTGPRPSAADRDQQHLGQPPARHRRHRRVPAQPRLRAAHHRAQRRRQHRVLRAGGVPARGQHLPLLRGGEGPRRRHQASGPTQIGLEGEFYPTYAFTKAQRTVLGLPRRQEPRDLDARLDRATSASTTARRSRSTRWRRRT